jgi:hypothetical protein
MVQAAPITAIHPLSVKPEPQPAPHLHLTSVTTPPDNRRAVMICAWAIFRTTYNHPVMPFRSIGRSCFAWALQKAWAEHRDRAAVATTPTDVRGAQIAQLERERQVLEFADNCRFAGSRTTQIDVEIRRLSV